MVVIYVKSALFTYNIHLPGCNLKTMHVADEKHCYWLLECFRINVSFQRVRAVLPDCDCTQCHAWRHGESISWLYNWARTRRADNCRIPTWCITSLVMLCGCSMLKRSIKIKSPSNTYGSVGLTRCGIVGILKLGRTHRFNVTGSTPD